MVMNSYWQLTSYSTWFLNNHLYVVNFNLVCTLHLYVQSILFTFHILIVLLELCYGHLDMKFFYSKPDLSKFYFNSDF